MQKQIFKKFRFKKNNKKIKKIKLIKKIFKKKIHLTGTTTERKM